MASLLFEPSEFSESAKLSRLLEYFGISATCVEPAGILDIAGPQGGDKSRLLCSARAFLKLLAATEQMTDGAHRWRENVYSAFVYTCGDTSSLQELARRLTGDDQTTIVSAPDDTAWYVSESHRDFCGSMSGVRVRDHSNVVESAVALGPSCPNSTKVVSREAGAAVLNLKYFGVPVILSTTRAVTDIDAPLTHPIFDIRREFLSAAPVVMYIKWAFNAKCWGALETGACVVIDDPPLTPRYGFLDYRHLLDLMRAHRFSTNIAFIPWNWRRSAAKVVRLFRENADRLSLSIHGCDHTRGEFGSEDAGRLAWRAKQATMRMAQHEVRTGIPFDRVMVFPQGVFSENAMGVLKRSGFIGTVNSDVISSDPHPRQIKVSDYWGIAVMSYSSFPIFTRRYPSDGVENFAFDILLGKPCLIVIHHGDCRDGCKALIELVVSLNALNAPIAWGGLGQVVRQSYRQREISPDDIQLEMYGTELQVQNLSRTRRRYRISKWETEPAIVKGVNAGKRAVVWHSMDDRIAFGIELDPGETQIVNVVFTGIPEDDLQGESFRYRAKAMLRRYISEARDNYISRRSSSA